MFFIKKTVKKLTLYSRLLYDIIMLHAATFVRSGVLGIEFALSTQQVYLRRRRPPHGEYQGKHEKDLYLILLQTAL